jgi:hypothetical protein
MSKTTVFGSPEAQAIAELDRAVQLLDAELRTLPSEKQPFVYRYEVEIVVGRLAGFENDTNLDLYKRAWQHLVAAGRWSLFQRGDKRIEDKYQPVDEDEE